MVFPNNYKKAIFRDLFRNTDEAISVSNPKEVNYERRGKINS